MSTLDPFAPLTAGEITRAAETIRAHRPLGESVRFASIVLREPSKAELVGPIDRLADVVLFERTTGILTEAVVDLRAGVVRSSVEVAGAMPPLLMEDAFAAMIITRDDPAWQWAIRRRGIDDVDSIQLDPWPAGWFGDEVEQGRRLVRVLAYVRDDPAANGYAKPVEGVIAVVDVISEKIVELIDQDPVAVPPQPGSYFPADTGPARADRKPLEITQPDGPSFTIDGYHLAWQRWDFSVSMHPVQGLVLHSVAYEDGDRLRPILHRAALSEMVVPYGDPDPLHSWKNAFDVGEWGIGRLTNSLTLGCDCLGEVHYLDAVLADEHGNPWIIEQAICVHEEDFGILWKHHDLHAGTTEVRRRRRLVVSSIHTVGNYEYAFYWYFYEDGTLQFETKMTGILQTKAVPQQSGTAGHHATLVAPGLAAPLHQHLFCMRLDLDVDGPSNTVIEVDVEADPAGSDNPRHNAFSTRETVLERESTAMRDIDPARSRVWKITNPSVLNGLGQPVAYKLVPGASPTLLAGERAAVSNRAAFARHHLWVTEYDPDEMRAAGDYVSQHPGGEGLPRYIEADRSLVGTDVVAWHTFGITHVPRPEDWPVMPTEHLGFSLVPFGFFDRNPALDVAPSEGHCHTD